MAASRNAIKKDVQSKKVTRCINGHQTDIVAQKFSNRIFIVISQCDSFGSLIDITRDNPDDMRPENAEIVCSVHFLMGIEDSVCKALARKLACIVFRDSDLPILLSIALKDKSLKSFKDIIEAVELVNVWEF